MGQISDGSIDAQNTARNLIEVIVSEVMKTLNDRTAPYFDPLESLKIQSIGDEETNIYVKSEGVNLEEMKMKENIDRGSLSDLCYQNLPEIAIHSSTLSTQGEGDFQPPYVRETKAFYYLGSEGISDQDHPFMHSSQSSVNTLFTDELITQLHTDINNISFDNIHLSDSEAEKELQTTECCYTETRTQVNQCCQTNGSDHFEDKRSMTNEEDHKLRHSQKFIYLSDDMFDQYFKLNENGEEKTVLAPSVSRQCLLGQSEGESSMDKFSQTNPFLCSSVNSTIALSSDCCESRTPPDGLSGSTVLVDKEVYRDSNEWVEANEVQIRTTEPCCSNNVLREDNPDDCDGLIQFREYWSNVGLIKESTVDRRYMGPVEVPGIESIKGVPRVREKVLTHDSEEIICVTEALEENALPGSDQDNKKSEESNFLLFNKKPQEFKKKRKITSKLLKAISSVFKFNNHDSQD